jgi:hypothetical protein
MQSFLFFLLLQSATALVTTNNTEWGVKKTKIEPPATKPTGAPIFYAVIMGRLAFRHQVSLWLTSVRKIGGWRGEAVIVTDKPFCLSETLKEAGLLGEKLSSSDAVDIYGPGQGYSGNLHMVKRPNAHSINMMKLEKARGWLNVKVAEIPHPVTSIVYTDEDVVIGKDLTFFMREVRTLETQKHTLALFRDTGASAGELHTGVVVMFPGTHTDQCLQAWGKKLTGVQIGTSLTKAAQFNSEDAQELALNEDNNIDADVTIIKENQLLDAEMAVMGPDQRALGSTKQCKKGVDHMGIKILPAAYFWLPTPGGLAGNHRAEFVHFTNTGRWKTISHGTIKKYLMRIGIPEKIDPTGKVQSKECAIPEGGTIADTKVPHNYGGHKRRR